MNSIWQFFKKQEQVPPKIRLVLSSGGARGIAHVGVIRALEANGFEIAEIAGSSMGALVGGVYAAGKLDEFAEWICDLDKVDVFKLVDFTLSAQGIVKGDRVFAEIKKIVGHVLIEELPMPYTAVATDMTARQEVALRKGDLFEAIRASVAIPTVMTPVQHEGRLLVDGGVLNPLPICYVQKHPNDLVVAVNVNADVPFEEKPPATAQQVLREEAYQARISLFKARLGKLQELGSKKSEKAADKKMGYFDLLIHSFDLMQDRLTALIIEHHRPDILVDIPRTACGTFEFYRAESMVEQGRLAFEKAFEAWIAKRAKRSSNVNNSVLF